MGRFNVGRSKGKKKRKLQKERKKGKKSDVLSMLSVRGMLMIYGLYCPLAISAGLFFQKKKTALNNLSPFLFFLLRVQVTLDPRNIACHMHLYYIYTYKIQVLELCCENFAKILKISYIYTYILLPPPVSDFTGFHA